MTASNVTIICLFFQVALTFYAIVRMGQVRIEAHKSRVVSFIDIAIDASNYPIRVRQFQNNVSNQFETPVLFYAVVAISMAMDAISWGIAAGAVIFVLARIVHYAIHTGSNNVRKRFNAFIIALSGLFICWVSLGLSLLSVF